MPRFINHPPPQTVIGPGVSGAIQHPHIYVQVTADCFCCITATGTGVDGNAVGATNGHFLQGGQGYMFRDVPLGHKLGISAGTAYISAVDG